MKILHIHAKSKKSINEVLSKVKLEGIIGLTSSVQYMHKLEEASKIIPNSIIAGQVLGCDASKAVSINDQVDCFLHIGSGTFHPIRIALDTNKPVYLANPDTNEFSRLPEEIIEGYKRSSNGKLSKFYASDKIGILVSTKPGQHNLNKTNELKQRFPEKQFYTFMFNTLTENDLENFPDIQFWINTACNRIMGKKIINAEDIKIQEQQIIIK